MLAQIVTLAIFVVMFAVIVIGKVHRYIPALIAAGLNLIIVFLLIMKSPQSVLNVLNLAQIGQLNFWLPRGEHIESIGVNWQTIIFIGGMMIMVEGMAAVGFFDWLCLLVAKLVKYKVVPLLVGFTLLSGFLAMFIDSITVLLFMTSIIIQLARLLKFDPVPIIIAAIFAANTGGSATMSGDPPNIIIGTAFGYTFMDFMVNTGLIAWAGMLLAVGFFYLVFRKSLKSQSQTPPSQYPKPGDSITDPLLFKFNTAIFLLVIALLVTHAQTGLSVAIIGVIAAFLTLAVGFKKAGHVAKRLDWRTLLFFVGLFICVGGLEATGALKAFAETIGRVSGGNMVIVITIVLWFSTVASAFVDNIPFAATMVPVIAGISQATGMALPPMAWALALGTDIGGNGTPIGASANVVGTAIAEREGHPISWGRYCKYGVPSTILVVALCWLLLWVRYM